MRGHSAWIYLEIKKNSQTAHQNPGFHILNLCVKNIYLLTCKTYWRPVRLNFFPPNMKSIVGKLAILLQSTVHCKDKYDFFNLFLTSGLVHPYNLEESISSLRGFW